MNENIIPVSGGVDFAVLKKDGKIQGTQMDPIEFQALIENKNDSPQTRTILPNPGKLGIEHPL